MHLTTIEWTDLTSNPIRGTLGHWHCVKISEGCRGCYAERLNRRWGGPDYRRGADTLRLDEEELHRICTAKRIGGRPVAWMKVFLGDMTDLFQDGVKPEWLGKIFEAMRRRPDLTFQLLTKRPQNVRRLLMGRTVEWPENVWLGVSVEHQQAADRRVPLFADLLEHYRIPVCFVSCEPLIEPVSLAPWMPREIGWVICGGESGPGARPMHPAWARALRDQCQTAGTPFFFKQWGTWAPVCDYYDDSGDRDEALLHSHLLQTLDGYLWDVSDGQPPVGTWVFRRTGKKAGGRVLDGREWEQFPSVEQQLELRAGCR